MPGWFHPHQQTSVAAVAATAMLPPMRNASPPNIVFSVRPGSPSPPARGCGRPGPRHRPPRPWYVSATGAGTSTSTNTSNHQGLTSVLMDVGQDRDKAIEPERSVMNMGMTGSNSVFSVPSEHLPGLIALVLFPSDCRMVHRAHHLRPGSPGDSAGSCGTGPDQRPSLRGTGGAGGHARRCGRARGHRADPLGDSTVLAVLFIADAVGFVAASVWVLLGGRHWRLASVGMLGGTVAGYVFYLAKGWETADPVGLLTTGVELVAALMLVDAERSCSTGNPFPPGGERRGRRCAVAAAASRRNRGAGTGHPRSARPTAPSGVDPTNPCQLM